MNLANGSKPKILAIVAGTVVACALLATLTSAGCGRMIPMEERAEHFDASTVENIAIDFPTGTLSIREAPAGDSEITVRERASSAASKSKLTCSVDNGTLTVKYQMNPLGWLPIYWFGSGQRELEVTIPADVLGDLQNFQLRCASGRAEVSGVSCQTADVTVSSGSLTTSDFAVAESTHLKLSSGQLNIRATDLGQCDLAVASGKAELSGAMSSLDVSVSSGSAYISCANPSLERANFWLSSGNAELRLPEDAGFDAAVSKSSGSFTCEFDASVRGETYTYGSGQTPIDIHISSGSMTLKPL